MLNRRNIIIILAFLIVLSLLYVVSPLSDVQDVVLINNGDPNPNLDSKLLDLKGNFWFFNTENLSNELMLTGLLDEVKVEKEFYCTVKITLTWKVPVISIKTADRFASLDKTGYVLYLDDVKKTDGFIDNLVVEYARIGEPIVTEDDALTANAVNIYFMFLENKDLFLEGAVKPDIRIIDGEIVQVISDQYWINFGDGNDYESKFAGAIAIYNDLKSKAVTTGIINVSRNNHYVYETWK